MMYVKYVLFALPLLALTLLTYILSPFFAVYSVMANVTVLPGILSFFHTHDDDMDGGQHQLDWPSVSGLKLIAQRTMWMWRNPAYGFKAYWFGIPKEGTQVIHMDSEYTKLITSDGKEYFCFKDNRETSKIKFTIGWAWWYDHVFMWKFGVKFG